MAGAGYKLFATGDVLTAAQVNTYLMQQTVMVFADSAARTTALSGVLAEGMVSYLQDTNTLEVYNGSAWVGATGDITGLTAGTGISITSETGPVPTVTNAMATEITAKGDLIVGTGSATFDNLAAGSNGDTLVADSSTSTGLRYTAGTVQANPVLNSAFQVWQRGTSISLTASSGNVYIADRWQTVTNANQACTVSRQATSDTTNLPNIQYALRYQRNSGQTGTGAIFNIQSFETINSIPFAGKTVTFSFYARAGANYSQASNGLTNYIITGTGTDQSYLAGYTGTVVAAANTATLTTTWQRFTYSATLGATATEITLAFAFSPTGTASTNDYYEVTGVQLDIGSVALPFRTNGETFQGELAACQRYYYRATVSTFNQPFAMGQCYNTTSAYGIVPFPVTMRTLPTALEQSGTAADYKLTTSTFGGSTTTTVPTFNAATQNAATVIFTAAAVFTAGHATSLVSSASGAYLGWSAEL